MKRFLLKICPLILMWVSYFSCYATPENSYLQNITDKDTITSIAQNKRFFLTFTPLQLVYGELLTGIEQQKSENIFNVYRVGFIYSFGDFYGLHFEYGQKTIIGYHFFRSIVLLAKYEKGSYGFDIDDMDVYPNHPLTWKYDDKYVLGVKVLYGVQTSYEHKIISDFYFGFGLRLHYYQNSLNFEKPNSSNSIIVPSIHLGFTLAYNLKKN